MAKKNPEKGKATSGGVSVDGNISHSTVISGNKNIVTITPPLSHLPDETKKLSAVSILLLIVGVVAVLIVLVLVVGYVLKSIIFKIPSPVSDVAPTATLPSPLVIPTDTLLAATATPLLSPALQFTPTFTPSVLPSSPPVLTLTPPAETMTAILKVSREEGKVPFNARLNARESFVRFADGQTVTCDMGNCTFRFTIFRDYQYVDAIVSTTGDLTYRFDKKGRYEIGVYVCRGQTCAEDGVTVIGK